MFDLIANVVAWFYSLWPSYGFAIIMLTLTVMVVVTPLTLKGTRSMLQMQLLQPELKRIQSKYGPGERQQMNEELMAFYQENGINPLGGCLPLLVQLPVFLVLFQVVRGMTRRATAMGTQLGWTSSRDVTTGPWDEHTIDLNERVFDPEYIPSDSELYADLIESNEMPWIGIDLSRSASSILGDGIIDLLPYLAMILIVLVSSLYQQRQIQGRNTGAQINPQQQAIMKIMPWFLPVFSWAMPAALVVYFIVSNLYRIGQQAYITHSLYSHDDSPGAQLARERSKKSDGDGPAKTEGKGRPTPKRSEARAARGSGKAKASRGAQRRGGGRRAAASPKSGGRGGGSSRTGSKAKPGDATPKRGGRAKDGGQGGGKGTSGGAKAGGGQKGGGKSAGKSASRSAGGGRTGRAPTRHGGRTTDPGSGSNRGGKGK